MFLILSGCDSSNNDLSSNKAESNVPALESECVELRNQWKSIMELNVTTKNEEQAFKIRNEYKNKGCFETCGRLIEDTDTIEKETWCE